MSVPWLAGLPFLRSYGYDRICDTQSIVKQRECRHSLTAWSFKIALHCFNDWNTYDPISDFILSIIVSANKCT